MAAKKILDLIAGNYDSAKCPELWSAVLTKLSDALVGRQKSPETGSVVAPQGHFVQIRAATIICAVLAFCLLANAQNEYSDIEHVKDEFMSKAFTKCNEGTYFFGPKKASTLECSDPNPTNRVNTAKEVIDCSELIEFMGVSFPHGGILKVNLLNTDRAAGVEEKVLFIINYTSYRSRKRVTDRRLVDENGPTHTRWDSWERPVINTGMSVSMDVNHEQEHRPSYLPAGTKAIGIGIKKSGQWMFYPGPDFPMPSFFNLGRAVGVDAGQGVESGLDSTRSLGTIADTLSSMLSGLNSNVIPEIASRKPASCASLFPEEWPPNDTASAKPEARYATSDLPKFDGTADQFAAAFPDYFHKAAQEAGVDEATLRAGRDWVVNAVRTCAQITPQMAKEASVGDQNGFRSADLQNLGSQYAVCQTGGRWPSNSYRGTRIALQIRTSFGPNGSGWLEGNGFTANIFFVDTGRRHLPYQIVFANIR